VTRLASKGLVVLEDIATASPAYIDTVANRHHPFGASLRAQARRWLGQALTLEVRRPDITKPALQVHYAVLVHLTTVAG
jgi:hypothetical protein